MNVAIYNIPRLEVQRLIAASPHITLSKTELKQLDNCMYISSGIFAGLVEDDLACVWGLVPPTLMSNQAYLWLYTTPLVEQHKFLLVRHSQRWIEQVLKEYDTIVGFCKPENKAAIKWIEWLGGSFKRPFGERAEFVIRNQDFGRPLYSYSN